MGGGQFTVGGEQLKFTFDKDGKPVSAETVDSDREVRRFVPEREWTPTPADLASFTGDWLSDESGSTLTIAIDAGKVYLKQRPSTNLLMQPLYTDHFTVQGYVLWFTRDKNGKVNNLHVGTSRMRDMPFVRVQQVHP